MKKLRIFTNFALILAFTANSTFFYPEEVRASIPFCSKWLGLVERFKGRTHPTENAAAPEEKGMEWRSQFIKAFIDNKNQRAFYALSNYLEANADFYELTSPEKRALKVALMEMELRYLENPQSPSQQAIQRLLNFAGYAPKGARHVSPGALKDFVWAFGPLFIHFAVSSYRIFHRRDSKRLKPLNSAFQKFLDKPLLISKIAESYPSMTQVTRESLQNIIQDMVVQQAPKVTKRPLEWFMGRLLMPWVLAGTLMTVGHTAYPRENLEGVFQLLTLEQFGDYPGINFIEDIGKSTGINLIRGSTLYLYSKDMFPQSDEPENPLKGVLEVKFLIKDSENAKGQAITSLSDLKNVNIDQYDNVILLTHGNADVLETGWSNDLKGVKLKKNANLIFISCSVGQRGEGATEENWVTFSKEILNGGKSIVATKDLTLHVFVPHPTIQEESDLQTLAIIQFIVEETGLPLLPDTASFVQTALTNKYFLKPTGLRIYDSKTGQTIYYPHFLIRIL